jgi:hypothetical protein
MDKIIGTSGALPFTTGDAILELSYLLAALLFVYGLKLLSHPETARKGNFYAAGGMVLAMTTTAVATQEQPARSHSADERHHHRHIDRCWNGHRLDYGPARKDDSHATIGFVFQCHRRRSFGIGGLLEFPKANMGNTDQCWSPCSG